MNERTRWTLTLAFLAAAGCGDGGAPEPPDALELDAVLGGDDAGFARALAPRAFVFPDDHGPHPEFRSEWWYFTGNLETESGRRFGYQWTLFRFALAPQPPRSPSHWATNQVYMGHFAVTDVQARRFHSFERRSRAAIGLAGAQAVPFRAWVENWQVRGQGDDRPWRLQAETADGVAVDLTLEPVKPVVLQGEAGLSRKSAAPGNASYYYSLTRIRTRGTVTAGGVSHRVQGWSWMDREWSTSALAPEQAGWDWFALQLDDGTDLMFYRLRRRDGGVDPLSSGTLVGPEGGVRTLAWQDVELEILEHWRSPRGVRYPARWRVRLPELDLELTVTPVLQDQEHDLSVRYWEGAVEVTGRRAGAAVSGRGYVELAGYGAGPRRP